MIGHTQQFFIVFKASQTFNNKQPHKRRHKVYNGLQHLMQTLRRFYFFKLVSKSKRYFLGAHNSRWQNHCGTKG